MIRLLILCVVALLPASLAAREVDIELVLAVDVSRSMSPAELEIQRRGYAEALISPQVVNAIEAGLLGRIALTYVEWAGSGRQRVVLPWTEIATGTDAAAAAQRISAQYTDSLRRTSISSALRFAADSIAANDFDGLRRVIDISGDGPNNTGLPVRAARDVVTAQGITINGLPLMTHDPLSALWGIEDLDVYYARCVIGGPGAFVLPVYEWSGFADAVRRKLVLEIADAVPSAQIVRVQTPAPYDCMIGEKIWEENRGYFMSP
ncbi:DUF1194 domain-containing protein [uncultured Sulfitobacter sp.]|uniref:DUF1194 domain-containing protein n=1 Tax=uncultured Sulfitobacter sp. TaxID=191468 RepID=UPI0026319242|nr:DUF1194 domain-containing protein [uncultured Sulfitobacter sp.]